MSQSDCSKSDLLRTIAPGMKRPTVRLTAQDAINDIPIFKSVEIEALGKAGCEDKLDLEAVKQDVIHKLDTKTSVKLDTILQMFE